MNYLNGIFPNYNLTPPKINLLCSKRPLILRFSCTPYKEIGYQRMYMYESVIRKYAYIIECMQTMQEMLLKNDYTVVQKATKVTWKKDV